MLSMKLDEVKEGGVIEMDGVLDESIGSVTIDDEGMGDVKLTGKIDTIDGSSLSDLQASFIAEVTVSKVWLSGGSKPSDPDSRSSAWEKRNDGTMFTAKLRKAYGSSTSETEALGELFEAAKESIKEAKRAR